MPPSFSCRVESIPRWSQSPKKLGCLLWCARAFWGKNGQRKRLVYVYPSRDNWSLRCALELGRILYSSSSQPSRWWDPHVVVSPNQSILSLLLRNCDSATVTNCKCLMCTISGMWPTRGWDPRVENFGLTNRLAYPRFDFSRHAFLLRTPTLSASISTSVEYAFPA